MIQSFLFFATTAETSLGGIARSVPRLAAAVGESGADVVLVAPMAENPTFRSEKFSHIRCIEVQGGAELKEVLRQQLMALKLKNGIAYHAGVWSPWNHFFATEARQRKIPYIASPRSMLDPWALNYRGWKKRLAWMLYAKRDLSSAAAIHATADLEKDHIKKKCENVPVFVVPNGVDPPIQPEGIKEKLSRRRRILFLSRLNPKKGAMDLLLAFASLKLDGWELVIAGTDENGMESVLKSQANRLGIQEQVVFTGELSDIEKWEFYFSADVFALPSYSENFGLVIAEALACGIPVITTTATPWAQVVSRNCGWYTNPGVNALTNVLKLATQCSPEMLKSMGENGRKWVAESFNWRSCGARFIKEVSRVYSGR